MSPAGPHRRRELRKAAARRAQAGRPPRDREAREVTINFTDPAWSVHYTSRSLGSGARWASLIATAEASLAGA